MGIPVKLEVFEGPLDLLLHLIDKDKVNIYDIPIVSITEQYMDYIRMMKTKDLDLMSEFLLMAATLLNIKSKMLLPKEEVEDGEEMDPRQELVERLLEYKMYKYISFELRDKQVDADRVMYKDATIPDAIKDFKEEVNIQELLSGLTLSKLHGIFKSVVKKQLDKVDPIRSQFGRIEKEEVNLSERILVIEQYARTHQVFSFRRLLELCFGKMEVIVTFLGILEMMKTGSIVIVQEDIFEDILITYNENCLEQSSVPVM